MSLPSALGFFADADAYGVWSDHKRRLFSAMNPQPVQLSDAFSLCEEELQALRQALSRYNFALYASTNAHQADPQIPLAIAAQLGISQLDHHLCADDAGVAPLSVNEERQRGEYIPYSNKKINWHTDGYYNAPDKLIRAMLLHCVHQAREGGANRLMDFEMLYIQLRDIDPRYVQVLCEQDVLTIPANDLLAEDERPARTGPVFSLDSGGHLHMRYTDRRKSIEWRSDSLLQEALECLRTLLYDENNPYIVRYRLQAGEGLICNNILHTRDGFADGESENERRLIYRARFYDRLNTEEI